MLFNFTVVTIWLLLNEDVSWNKQSVIGRLFGATTWPADNRPKHYQCTSSIYVFSRDVQLSWIVIWLLCVFSVSETRVLSWDFDIPRVVCRHLGVGAMFSRVTARSTNHSPLEWNYSLCLRWIRLVDFQPSTVTAISIATYGNSG